MLIFDFNSNPFSLSPFWRSSALEEFPYKFDVGNETDKEAWDHVLKRLHDTNSTRSLKVIAFFITKSVLKGACSFRPIVDAVSWDFYFVASNYTEVSAQPFSCCGLTSDGNVRVFLFVVVQLQKLFLFLPLTFFRIAEDLAGR